MRWWGVDFKCKLIDFFSYIVGEKHFQCKRQKFLLIICKIITVMLKFKEYKKFYYIIKRFNTKLTSISRKKVKLIIWWINYIKQFSDHMMELEKNTVNM